MNTAQQFSEGARAILSAAGELFARDGFDAVSMGSIAEAVGVSKSNIFHHFASKEDLILAVLHDAGRPHAEYAEQLLQDDGPVRDKLQKLIEFEFTQIIANRRNMQLISHALGNHCSDDGQRFAERIFKRNFRAVTALFEQAQQNGEFRRDIDASVAATILAGTHEVCLRFMKLLRSGPQRQQKPMQNYIDTVFKVLLEGLLAPTPRVAHEAQNTTNICRELP